MRHARAVGHGLAAQDQGHVRVHDRRVVAPGQGGQGPDVVPEQAQRARERPAAEQVPPEHGERLDVHVDPGLLELLGEVSALGQDHQRPESRPVEHGRQQQQLPVRAVAAGGSVDEQDRLSQTALILHQEAHRAALILGTAALLVRLPVIGGPDDPTGDTFVYLSFADDLWEGRGFDRAEQFYTPGYPALMAAVRPLPGSTEVTLAVLQHLLGAAVVAVIVLATWRWFGRVAAWSAGLLAAFTPLLVISEHFVLPDFVFGVLVLAGALLLAEACTRAPPPLALLALSGVTFGLAAWIKPAGQFLLVAPPLALLFATRSVRPALRGSAVVLLAMVLTVSPWLYRNLAEYDSPLMSNQGGLTLFNRAFEVDRLPFPEDSEYAGLARRVRAEDVRTGTRFHSSFRDALKEAGAQLPGGDGRAALAGPHRHLEEPGRLRRRHRRRDGRGGPRRDSSRTSSASCAATEAARSRSSRTGPGACPRCWSGPGSWPRSPVPPPCCCPSAASERSRRAAVALLSVWFVVTLGTVLSNGTTGATRCRSRRSTGSSGRRARWCCGARCCSGPEPPDAIASAHDRIGRDGAGDRRHGVPRRVVRRVPAGAGL